MSANKPGNTGIARLVKACGYSMRGFASCFKSEAAFRQEVAASLLILPLGLWLGQTGMERALLVASWLLVPMVEMLNSAIEAVVDRIGPEHHELSGQAKDIGSAAVFLAIALFLLVWALVLFPHLVNNP
ncbi:diacylglycerol kinase [Thiolapillus sp.]